MDLVIGAFRPLMASPQHPESGWCFLFVPNTWSHLLFNLLFPCIYILSQWISIRRPYQLAVSINWLTSTGSFQWTGGSCAQEKLKVRALLVHRGVWEGGQGNVAASQGATDPSHGCELTWTISSGVSSAKPSSPELPPHREAAPPPESGWRDLVRF